MVKGVTAFACALVLAGALVASPAQAGDPFAVKAAKHKDGPYSSDLKSNIAPGETRNFWFRVTNKGDVTIEKLVFDDADTSDLNGYETRWFKRGDNVSSQVEGDGYGFRIHPGKPKYFNARHTRAPGAGALSCIAGQANLGMANYTLASVLINGKLCAY